MTELAQAWKEHSEEWGLYAVPPPYEINPEQVGVKMTDIDIVHRIESRIIKAFAYAKESKEERDGRPI